MEKMELKFANGTTLELVRFMPSHNILRGATRETLSFMFEERKHGYAELKSLFADAEATEKITLTNPHDVGPTGTSKTTTEYTNYVVPAEPMIQPAVEVVDQTNPVPVDVFLVTMGKLTYVEEQLKKLGIDPLG